MPDMNNIFCPKIRISSLRSLLRGPNNIITLDLFRLSINMAANCQKNTNKKWNNLPTLFHLQLP